jgi:hypothetical protein
MRAEAQAGFAGLRLQRLVQRRGDARLEEFFFHDVSPLDSMSY